MSRLSTVQSTFSPIETSTYRVRLAESATDRQAVFRLRYEVFVLETGNTALQRSDELEQDSYDVYSQHLIVEERSTGQIVGTYRLLEGELAIRSTGFYSQTEFDFTHSIFPSDQLLELGRSCVAPAYRNGRVISLLWEGVIQYLNHSQAQWCIGCASMPVPKLYELNTLVTWLRGKGFIRQDTGIHPLPTHRIYQLQEVELLQNDRELFRMLPPLIKGYLSLGALFACEPAYDPVFDTIDFLVIMPRESINPRHLKRMNKE